MVMAIMIMFRMIMASGMVVPGRLAPRRVVVPCLVESPGAQKVLRSERLACFAPGNGASRQHKGLGKMRAD